MQCYEVPYHKNATAVVTTRTLHLNVLWSFSFFPRYLSAVIPFSTILNVSKRNIKDRNTENVVV